MFFNLSSYGLEDEKYQNEQLQTNISDPAQVVIKAWEWISCFVSLVCNFLTHVSYCLWKIARAVYDVEEATSTAFDIILQHKVKNAWIPVFPISFMLSQCDFLPFLMPSPMNADDQIRYKGFTYKIPSTFGGSSPFQKVCILQFFQFLFFTSYICIYVVFTFTIWFLIIDAGGVVQIYS